MTACCMLCRQELKSNSMDPDLHSVQNTLRMTLWHHKHYGHVCLATFVRRCDLISFWHLLTLSRYGVAAISEFLKWDKPNMAALFSNLSWLAKLVCLDDIFDLLNSLFKKISEIQWPKTAFIKKKEDRVTYCTSFLHWHWFFFFHTSNLSHVCVYLTPFVFLQD